MTAINTKWRAKLSNLEGTVWLEGNETGLQVRYPRHTRLGARLLSNARLERIVLSNYIRQEFGLPRGEANMTPITWVGV